MNVHSHSEQVKEVQDKPRHLVHYYKDQMLQIIFNKRGKKQQINA